MICHYSDKIENHEGNIGWEYRGNMKSGGGACANNSEDEAD